jgi:hypothetical protein
MPSVDDALRTQIANIEAQSGQSMAQWRDVISQAGLTKHGAIVSWLKADHGMSHGNANRVAIEVLRPADAPAGDAVIDAIYAGKSAALRPLHDDVIALARGFGSDVELAPKKTYVSLRRKQQFGMVGPGSGGTLEIGLNLPDAPVAGRMGSGGGMLSRRVRIKTADEFYAELRGWLRDAYDRS